MKRSELFFDAIRLPADVISCLGAGVLAYLIRVSPIFQNVRPVLFEVELPFREYFVLVAAMSLFILLVFAALGLYAMESTRRLVDEFTRIVAGITLAFFGVIFWMFIRAELFNSRFIVLSSWLFAILLVASTRSAIRLVQRRLLRRGIGVHRVVLLGQSPIAEGFLSLFQARPQLGYRVVGQLPRLDIEALQQIERDHGIDEIIRCDRLSAIHEDWVLLDFCEDYKVDFRYVPDLYETRVGNVVMRTLGGFPIVDLRRTPLEGWGRVWKRMLDLVGAALGLLLLSPLFLVVALAIVVESRGLVFFRQVRTGKNQKPFRIFKFRTMMANAEELKGTLLPFNERSGPLFKMANDPRVTRVGRFLRKTRIDELPQLFNVVVGQMSLIGPRPHLPDEIAQYQRNHRKLFTIKPGMTGLAQVSGGANLPFEEEAAMDIHYIENWSPKLDVFILIRTLWRLLGDRSAV